MNKNITRILLIGALLVAACSAASAQGKGNVICPTAAVGTSDNRCASTAFVNNGFGPGFGTLGYALIGNGASLSTYQGFLQAGTGATPRPWQSKAADTFSAKDFGAVGDGAHDDTANIQAAITAASVAGGGTVFFPTGTYKTTAVITLATNVNLVGAARAQVLIFPTTNSQTVFSLTYGSVTDAHFSISDLTLYSGTTTGVTGISITSARNILMNNLAFEGLSAYSIILDRGGQSTLSNILVEGNPGQLGSGIKLWSSDDADYIGGVVISNLVGLNIGNGFNTPLLYLRRAVATMATNIYSNDMHTGTPQNGIVIENDSQGNQISNVEIGSSLVGLLVQQGTGVAVAPTFNICSNCSFDQPYTIGISQTAGYWNSYLGGKLTSSGANTTIPAISISGSVQTAIQNYTIMGFSGIGGSAISLGANTDKVLISGNIFDTNTTIINFAAAATNVSVNNNNFSTFTNQTLGTATGGRFVNNIGSTVDALYLSNIYPLYGRNAANTANISLLVLDAGNNLEIGSSGTGLVAFNNNTLPSGDNIYALGGASNRWSDFRSVLATIGTINAFTLGGTVAGGGNQLNNVIIGTSTPLAGAFTTLNATGQITSTLAIGTAPLVVTSTTLVANFHAALADAAPVGGISGLGTGVATALGVNVGTAGAPVVNGGALGSPSSAGTIPAYTLGGTVAGGGNQINNAIIGTTTPLAGFFTTLNATTAFLNTSAVPTLSTCGTGSPVAATGSGNQGGQFTVGGGTILTCTVTFANAYPNYAFCTIHPASSAAAAITVLPYISASSKTAFTVTMAASTPGAVFNYNCQGQ